MYSSSPGTQGPSRGAAGAEEHNTTHRLNVKCVHAVELLSFLLPLQTTQSPAISHRSIWMYGARIYYTAQSHHVVKFSSSIQLVGLCTFCFGRCSRSDQTGPEWQPWPKHTCTDICCLWASAARRLGDRSWPRLFYIEFQLSVSHYNLGLLGFWPGKSGHSALNRLPNPSRQALRPRTSWPVIE